MNKAEYRGIYNQFHGLVSKIAYSVIQDYHLTQDITQDIFVSLYQNKEKIDLSKVKGWLITCTTRRAIDYKRKLYYEQEVVGATCCTCENVCVSTECTYLIRELYGEVLMELYHKNRNWFELVIRIDVDGEEPVDVARDLEITMNNLRVRHSRAKAWLNRKFKER